MKIKDDLIQYLADEIDGSIKDIEICKFISLIHAYEMALLFIKKSDCELYNRALINVGQNLDINLEN